MSDRTVIKEKIGNKNGEAHHHHGQTHQSQKEEKEARSLSKVDVNDSFYKRYKLLDKIGEGSYSEVLKCQNKHDGTVVACKRLKHNYRTWCDVNNIAEIATLRTIPKHSNILQMIEIHFDEPLGRVSLVFELMDVNLYELIKDRKRLLPESRVRTIMFQLFRALRHLHKLGVFHRDIKPENILIRTKTDQLKLGDLGSVRGMFSRPPYTEYISTRWYRSPECLLTAGHYSHKMDVWAAGCVFYEVLTLRPLFPGSSEIDQINRINNILGPPPVKLLDTFQKQAEMERDTYRGQSQLNRRQQIQKVLDDYSSKYMTNESKSNKSIKSSSRNTVDYHFSAKDQGAGLDKILPTHISREAKEIIKACLQYDPELRPTAQRVIQLSYFYEMRESYAKNPDKVSSKPVLTICGEVITEQYGTVDLGTLGDNKMKYRRGHSQRVTKQSSTAYSQSKTGSKLVVADKKSSKDTNNNYDKNSPSPHENSLASLSRSKLSNADGKGMSRSSKVLSSNSAFTAQKERKPSVDVNNNKVQSSKNSQAMVNQVEIETASKVASSKVRSKILQQTKKNKKDSTSASSSFESVNSQSNNRNSKYKYKFNPSSQQQKPAERTSSLLGNQKEVKGSALGVNLPTDIQLSPYVKAPSELKFLQKKIKGDQAQGRKPSMSVNPILPQKQEIIKTSIVPPKIAAAAIKFVKSQNANHNSTITSTKQSLIRQTFDRETNGRGSNELQTPMEDAGVSVKLGKLRFRHKQQQQQKKEASSRENTPSPQHRSKIPLFVDEGAVGRSILASDRSRSKQTLYRSSKLTSPPDSSQRRTPDITEKWRNTGIPRMIMSPERERNIRLLRESLTIDKNKRLRIRRLEQDVLNSNVDTNSSAHLGSTNSATRNHNLDYTSNDTITSGAGQQRVAGATYSSGRYRNSTTDYENPDVQDTSSASAAAPPENRTIFNVAGSARKRIPIPSEDMMKKPAAMKKSSNLYPPEILDIYSSRYRGPDVNMNILKDSANYVKHSDRTQEVKEKLNQKLEIRRRQQLNSSSVGDHPSKLASERSSSFMHDYGQYSSGMMNNRGGTTEEQYSRSTIQTGNKTKRFERRPPIPPGKLMGMKHVEPSKTLQSYRDMPPEENAEIREARPSYQNARRGSMIPVASGGTKAADNVAPTKSTKRNAGTAEQLRKEFKEQTKRRVERMRSTMRDDVFCSSDDDVVISMRKKFDTLISERARKLSESLKSNPLANETSQEARKYYDSEEDISPPPNARSKHTANEKARKYARRELRARMAESLTMNNIASNHWRLAEHRTGRILLENSSNNSGDFVGQPSYNERGEGSKKYALSGDKPMYQQQPLSFMRSGKDINNDSNDYRDNKYHHQQAPVSSRIYPFSRHEKNSRHGQIYTPPGNKPVYQSPPDVGAMLHDRNLRYSHNLPVPIPNSQSNYSQRGRSINEDMKKRQRI